MSNINDIEKNMTGAFTAHSIKEKIVSGIKTATEQLGIKLTNGEWIGEGSACALGCMLLAEKQVAIGEGEQSEYEEKAASMLGVDSKWINAFISGFDAEYFDGYGDKNKEAYALGTQLRMEYNVDNTALDEDDEEDESDDCDCSDCIDDDDNE